MPIKPIFTRLPLTDNIQHPLAPGQVRTTEAVIRLLYQKTLEYPEERCMLEPGFLLSCMLLDHPEEALFALKIRALLSAWDREEITGTTEEQICLARAALQLYEYTADKTILKTLTIWLRKTEAEWENIRKEWGIRIQPADLMGFLIRFYRITGLKAVLRMCGRLRSAALDWTTVFHQKNVRQEIDREKALDAIRSLRENETNEIDFFTMQDLINHAELLADGMRYCGWSSMFSGNALELSAGRCGWKEIKKNHYAICGGTTADPFLSGKSPSASIDPAASAAWAEAMMVQMRIHGEPWAVDELVRIVQNNLSAFLHAPELLTPQTVNRTENKDRETNGNAMCPAKDETRVIARMARAVGEAYHYACTVMQEGICLNLMLKGKYLMQINRQNFLIQNNEDGMQIKCKEPFSMKLSVYHAATETAQMKLKIARKKTQQNKAFVPEKRNGTGIYMQIDREWKHLDSVLFCQEEQIYSEETYHQGKCWFVRNKLMVMNTENAEYRYAAAGEATKKDGQLWLPVCRISRWPCERGIPLQLPVLPAGETEKVTVPLTPYDQTQYRIAMFPKAKNDG